MLHLRYYPFDLAFQHPFTTNKGTKTHQPILVVSLSLRNLAGFGEAPAISYYDVSIEQMMELLKAKKPLIERYALTDPLRYWHFLHHLLPGHNFLIAALDMAGWDLFSKMRRQPLYKMLGLEWKDTPLTDYTIGMGTAEEMIAKMKAKPWPIYKVKMASPDDIDLVRALRAETDARLRVDANEGWQFDDAKLLLPELQKLGVQIVEQPLHRSEHDAMKELKTLSPIPLFADESCQVEQDVTKCAEAFHGINIKLTKCGGITPATRMIKEARSLGIKVMMGSMCETTIGSAAIAHMMPLLDEVDNDGTLLLKEDIATGLTIEDGKITVGDGAGLGILFKGQKFEV